MYELNVMKNCMIFIILKTNMCIKIYYSCVIFFWISIFVNHKFEEWRYEWRDK